MHTEDCCQTHLFRFLEATFILNSYHALIHSKKTKWCKSVMAFSHSRGKVVSVVCFFFCMAFTK